MKRFFILLTFLSVGTALFSVSAAADVILFHNGDILNGAVRQQTAGQIIFESENLGVLTIDRALVSQLNLAAPKDTKPPVETETHPAVEWQREVEGNYQLKRGNTQTEELGGKLFVNRKREKIDEWTFKGRAYYSSAEKKMNAQQYYGMARYAWSFGEKKKWYHFTRGEGDHDRFANIHARYVPATGIGYWFSDGTPLKALLEGGVGVEWTQYRSEKSNTTEVLLPLRAYLEWQIVEQIILSEEFLLYPHLTDFGAFRFHSEMTLSVPLYHGFLLRFSLVNEYQSNPGPQVQKNDLRLETGLAYAF